MYGCAQRRCQYSGVHHGQGALGLAIYRHQFAMCVWYFVIVGSFLTVYCNQLYICYGVAILSLGDNKMKLKKKDIHLCMYVCLYVHSRVHEFIT